MLIKTTLNTALDYLRDEEKKHLVYVKESWSNSYRQAINLTWSLASYEETGHWEARHNLFDTDFYLEYKDDNIMSSINITPNNIMLTATGTEESPLKNAKISNLDASKIGAKPPEKQEFKVYDKVRVVAVTPTGGWRGALDGKVGRITKIDRTDDFSYYVSFPGGGACWFEEESLELLENNE